MNNINQNLFSKKSQQQQKTAMLVQSMKSKIESISNLLKSKQTSTEKKQQQLQGKQTYEANSPRSAKQKPVITQQTQYWQCNQQQFESTYSEPIGQKKKQKSNIKSSLLLLSSFGSVSDQQQQSQENKDKRKHIYEHQAYKQQQQSHQNQNSSLIETNNRLFQMIFIKKQSKNTSISAKILPSSLLQEFKQQKKIQQESGLKWSDFIVKNQIGKGKSGEVYCAMHKTTGFICAIKKISKTDVDSKSITQLIRQIKIQSFLDHCNIAKLYAFFKDQKNIYLVMEYCASGDLYHLLKKAKKLNQYIVQNIVKQVCKGLQYMHQRNILHRDLKPQNILYHNGMIKICDFGWSISSTVNRQTFCGTPLYVSPQLLKRNNYNNKIDVWSVGILTYQLLFNRVPFEIFSEGDLIKIVQDDIKFSKSVNIAHQTKQFILSCLQKDPRDRLTINELLQHPFLTKLMVQQPST